MSFITRTILILLFLAGSVIPVLGAAVERKPPDNLAVWIFLGFCASIIVAQIFPLVLRFGRKKSRSNLEEVGKIESHKSSAAK